MDSVFQNFKRKIWKLSQEQILLQNHEEILKKLVCFKMWLTIDCFIWLKMEIYFYQEQGV